jgi:hypothetical protein
VNFVEEQKREARRSEREVVRDDEINHAAALDDATTTSGVCLSRRFDRRQYPSRLGLTLPNLLYLFKYKGTPVTDTSTIQMRKTFFFLN